MNMPAELLKIPTNITRAAKESVESGLPYRCLGCETEFKGTTVEEKVQAALDHYDLPFTYVTLKGTPEEQAEQLDRVLTQAEAEERAADERAKITGLRLN